jgi:hypothetical protein
MYRPKAPSSPSEQTKVSIPDMAVLTRQEPKSSKGKSKVSEKDQIDQYFAPRRARDSSPDFQLLTQAPNVFKKGESSGEGSSTTAVSHVEQV